jgi:hypothetical protein
MGRRPAGYILNKALSGIVRVPICELIEERLSGICVGEAIIELGVYGIAVGFADEHGDEYDDS